MKRAIIILVCIAMPLLLKAHWFSAMNLGSPQKEVANDNFNWNFRNYRMFYPITVLKLTSPTDSTVKTVATISALQSYNGSSSTILVTDSLRGGIFTLTPGYITTNSVTTFTSVFTGMFWRRLYNVDGGIYPEWAGARGDSVTNDQTAMQLAFNVSNNINLKHGAVYSVVTLRIPKGYTSFTLNGNGAKINNSFSTISGNTIIRNDTTGRTAYIPISVTSNPFKGDSSIAVSSTTGLKKGDMIYLSTGEQVGPVITRYLKSELMIVANLTSTRLTFTSRINYDMIKDSIKVYKINPLSLKLKNLELSNYGLRDIAVNAGYLRDSEISGVIVKPAVSYIYFGMIFSYNMNLIVRDCRVERTFISDGSPAYGIAVGGKNILIDNCNIVSAKAGHGITSPSLYTSQNITVQNCTLSNCDTYAIDFHGNSIDGRVINCTVSNSFGGVLLRAATGSYRIDKLFAYNIGEAGVYLNPEPTNTITNVTIQNSIFYNTNISSEAGSITTVTGKNIYNSRILNNTFTKCNNKAISIYGNTEYANNLIIQGNTIESALKDGIRICGSNNVITDNTINSFGWISTSYGIMLTDSGSYNIIARNRISKTARLDTNGIRLDGTTSNNKIFDNDVSSFAQANGINTAGSIGTNNLVNLNYKANGLDFGAVTATTVNGNTITTGTGILTLGAGTTLSNLNTIKLNKSGRLTLADGVATVTITGVATGSNAAVTLISIGGTTTTTWQYKAVCVANTLTITAITNSGATNTSDSSTLNYLVTN